MHAAPTLTVERGKNVARAGRARAAHLKHTGTTRAVAVAVLIATAGITSMEIPAWTALAARTVPRGNGAEVTRARRALL